MEGIKRVSEFLDQVKTYFIATVEGNKPKVRPFGTVIVYDGKLYIQSGKGKEVVKQIKNNPFVEICGFDGTKWLRISAELVNDNNHDVKVAMLEKMPELKGLYNANDDSMEMFYLKNPEAVFCSFTSAPEKLNF